MDRSMRTQRSLSKQEEIDEGDEVNQYEDVNNTASSEANNVTSSSFDEQSGSPPNNNYSNNCNNSGMLHRSRSQSKVKLLVRSHAVREETSPPPDRPLSPQSPQSEQPSCGVNGGSSPGGSVSPAGHSQQSTGTNTNTTTTSTTTASRGRHKLKREGSSQGSTESWEPVLSRGNSKEYDGNSTIDLHQFIVETLNNKYKDRLLLFRIESELLSLARDSKRTAHKFGQMSSYQRMLVHRVAAYFGMEHNVDPSGLSVIVNTTKNTRIPDRRFREMVREDLLEEPRRSILKRDSSSFDETGSFKNGDRMLNGDSRRSKSFEEREEEYEKVRRRIFNREHSVDGEIECIDDLHWGQGNYDPNSRPISDRNSRLLKVESYESGEALKANSLRLSVSKSHSFNGYEQQQPNSRVLTKQDSGSSMSSRISPSSSGYKSQRSDATLSATPSPTATPNLHSQLSSQSLGGLSPEPDTGGAVVWAVTDLASVPPGSLLIHPQSGQPYTNPDGSIYHYDPANPPGLGGGSENKGESVEESVPEKGSQQGAGAGGGPVGGRGALGPPAYDGGGYLGGFPTYHQGMYPAGQQLVLAAPAPPDQQPPPPHPPPPPHQPHHPPPPTYHPPPPPPPPNHQSHPVLYPQPPHSQPFHHLPHHCSTDNTTANELATCMMGLSFDNGRTVGGTDPRPVMYWQPHVQQGQLGGQGASSIPVYYAQSGGSGTNSLPPGPRYQGSQPAPPPPPPPPAPIHHQMPPPPFTNQVAQPPQQQQIPPQPHAPDHTSCYGNYAVQECVPYAPSGLHMYYNPQCASNSGSTGTPVSYYNTVGNCGSGGPLVAGLPYQQPCPAHATPPHTPQGMCGTLGVCYPGTHYVSAGSGTLPPTAQTQPAPPPTLPQLFRKPALQVGVRCASPMRGPYPSSPSMKDRADDKPHLQQALSLYGIRVVPGDMRLFGNTGRIPFAFPTTKPIHNRRHNSRGKMGSAGPGRVSTDVIDQQQTGLSTTLEVTGIHSKA